MITNSDNKLQVIQSVGNGKYHIYFNEQEVEIGGRISYNYDTIIVNNCDRQTIIQAIIAFKYSIEDELKLLYRGSQEEIEEHEKWVQFAKELYQKTIQTESVEL